MGAPSGSACLAEYQTAGRGRQGRPWLSPKGNLCLSLLWRFPKGTCLEGLSLAMGVAVAQALMDAGAEGIALKWPNDVLGQGKKLAGILVEVGQTFAVIGVGVNIHMPPEEGGAIDQPWIDMQTLMGKPVSRNRVGRRVLESLLIASMRFEREALMPFREVWSRLDILEGKGIELRHGASVHRGVAQGIDKRGRLLLKQGKRIQAFSSGEAHLIAP